jgi:PAS domain S-box-containing protein
VDLFFDESKFTFSDLIDSMSDAVLIVNNKGKIIRKNGQAEALFHYSHDELLGKSIESLLPASLREIHVKYRDLFNANPVKRPMGSMLCRRSPSPL